MTFCTECGQDHHAGEREAEAEVKRVADTEVELARINRKADVEIARIQAGAAETIAGTEAESEVAHAEGVAEGMETVIDAATPDSPQPAAEPAPIEVAVPEAEPEPDDAPPKADAEPEHHEPERKRGFF